MLENTNCEYGRYDSFTLRDMTHNLKSWRKNYPDKDANTSNPMPYEDFFLDVDDNGMLDIIREDQEARDFLR